MHPLLAFVNLPFHPAWCDCLKKEKESGGNYPVLFCFRTIISRWACWTSYLSSTGYRPISPTPRYPRNWRSCASTSAGKSKRNSRYEFLPSLSWERGGEGRKSIEICPFCCVIRRMLLAGFTRCWQLLANPSEADPDLALFCIRTVNRRY